MFFYQIHVFLNASRLLSCFESVVSRGFVTIVWSISNTFQCTVGRFFFLISILIFVHLPFHDIFNHQGTGWTVNDAVPWFLCGICVKIYYIAMLFYCNYDWWPLLLIFALNVSELCTKKQQHWQFTLYLRIRVLQKSCNCAKGSFFGIFDHTTFCFPIINKNALYRPPTHPYVFTSVLRAPIPDNTTTSKIILPHMCSIFLCRC